MKQTAWQPQLKDCKAWPFSASSSPASHSTSAYWTSALQCWVLPVACLCVIPSWACFGSLCRVTISACTSRGPEPARAPTPRPPPAAACNRNRSRASRGAANEARSHSASFASSTPSLTPGPDPEPTRNFIARSFGWRWPCWAPAAASPESTRS